MEKSRVYNVSIPVFLYPYVSLNKMIGLAERKFQQRFVQRSAQVVAPQKRRPYAYAEVAELYISGIKE